MPMLSERMMEAYRRIERAMGFGRSRQWLQRRLAAPTAKLDFSTEHRSFLLRNKMIRDALPERRCWILDVGSNTGETTRFLAASGHMVIGVEKFQEEYSEAVRKPQLGAGFLLAEVGSGFFEQAPSWDAILLLSVLHRIYASEGESVMRKVLEDCGKVAQNIFLEGSIRHSRYMDLGHEAPGFEDLQEASSFAWHKQLVDDCLGEDWKIIDYKSLPCTENEPVRLYFHLRKEVRVNGEELVG